jgi:hypothetical protein
MGGVEARLEIGCDRGERVRIDGIDHDCVPVMGDGGGDLRGIRAVRVTVRSTGGSDAVTAAATSEESAPAPKTFCMLNPSAPPLNSRRPEPA